MENTDEHHQVLLKAGKEGYRKLLKTQEWKDFADRIKANNGYTCEHCGATTGLNVHHFSYDGRLPWEYGDHEVAVLCQDCHKTQHSELEDFKALVCPEMNGNELGNLIGSLVTGFDRHGAIRFLLAIDELVFNDHAVDSLIESRAQKYQARGLTLDLSEVPTNRD